MAVARWALLTGTVSALALAMGLPSPVSASAGNAGAASAGTAQGAGAALNRALARLVRQPDGPPGIAVVVQRGRQRGAARQAGVCQAQPGQHPLAQLALIGFPGGSLDHQADDDVVGIGVLVLRPGREVEPLGAKDSSTTGRGALRGDLFRALPNALVGT